jgi:U3 small nucleolar ribonucleoprotein component
MNESEKFDTVVRKILSVSHEELQRREKEWKRRQARKKRAKTSPASRVSIAKG